METRVPHLYVDTTVVLDLFFNRRPASVQLLETARSRGWEVSTSQFTVMEVLDVVQDHRWFVREVAERHRPVSSVVRERHRRKLTEETLRTARRDVGQFLGTYGFIQYFYLNEDGFNRAAGLCAVTNMSAPDCLHVATAVEAGCDLLVTSDDQVVQEAPDFIDVARPEEAKQKLRELGFDLPR